MSLGSSIAVDGESVDDNAQLRADLREDRKQRHRSVPPLITEAVALDVFRQHLASHPLAAPEAIAVEMVARADRWDEVTAIQQALREVLRSATSEPVVGAAK